VLLLDEPTRGIDVGAKADIYRLMAAWTREGIAILLTTSEMGELITLSHRILVMHRGRVTAALTRETASRDAILSAAMGDRRAPDPGPVGGRALGSAGSTDPGSGRGSSPGPFHGGPE